MKKLVVLSILLTLTIGQIAFAQSDVELNSFSIAGGQGALTSGVVLTADFSLNDDLILFSIGEKDVYAAYLKKLGFIYSGPSLEYFHNIPTLGLFSKVPIYSAEKFSFSVMNWSGISAGTPGEKADLLNWKPLFCYSSATVAYGPISLSTATMWYADKWGWLFELCYKQKLTDNISAFTSGGYNYYGDGNYLFKIGLSYDF